MNLEEAVAAVECCPTHEALTDTLQRVVTAYGFASYCFIDVGKAHVDLPYYVGTTGPAWEREYQINGFVHVDECIRMARRTNKPFSWSNVPMPARLGRKKPGAIKTMEAAADHGFREGLVIPFHFVDEMGRMHSSVCTLMWKDRADDFFAVKSLAYQELHLILIYWMQRSIELREASHRGHGAFDIARARADALTFNLTDRERDVLAWAARGKTMDETAEILVISADTVETHIRNAVDKLGAGNKTHAAIKALYLGLIDY